MILEQMGFAAGEVFPCELRSGLVLIRGEVNGEPVLLELSTEQPGALVLDLDYANTRGLAVDHQSRAITSTQGAPMVVGVAQIGTVDCSLLGERWAWGDVGAITMQHPDWGQLPLPLAGRISAGMFRRGVFGLDVQSSTVAYAQRDVLNACTREAGHRLSLVPLADWYVPLTKDIADSALTTEDQRLFLVLGTGETASNMSIDYVRSAKGQRLFRWFCERVFRRGQSTMMWSYMLPDGSTVRVLCGFQSVYPKLANTLGVERVDGTLGMNFLGKWISVFDFRAGEVLLFEY